MLRGKDFVGVVLVCRAAVKVLGSWLWEHWGQGLNKQGVGLTE